MSFHGFFSSKLFYFESCNGIVTRLLTSWTIIGWPSKCRQTVLILISLKQDAIFQLGQKISKQKGNLQNVLFWKWEEKIGTDFCEITFLICKD